MRLLSLLLIVFSVANNTFAATKDVISVLAWDKALENPAIREAAKAAGFDYTVSHYSSNEESVPRLIANKDSFDVFIGSNVVIPHLLKENAIIKNTFEKSPKNEFLTIFSATENHCRPFWVVASIYWYKFNEPKPPPKTLMDLKRLKQENTQIGIIDDKFEFLSRTLMDNSSFCLTKKYQSSPLKRFLQCQESLKHSLNFSQEDFYKDKKSLSTKVINSSNIAFYGWSSQSKSIPQEQLKFSVPNIPIIGYDSLCIVNKSKQPATKTEKIKKFINFLSSKKIVELNSKANQTFSPYKRHIGGLNPKAIEIYKSLVTNIQANGRSFITLPPKATMISINQWWSKIRYE